MKRIQVFYQGLLNWLLRRLPEKILGESTTIQQKAPTIDRPKDMQSYIAAMQKQTVQRYLIIVSAAIVMGIVVWFASATTANTVHEIQRPNIAEGKIHQNYNVEIRYNGTRVRTKATLNIAPLPISEKEANNMISTTSKRLPEFILNGNPGLDQVSKDLKLTNHYPGTDAVILWESDNADLLDHTGRLDSIMAERGGKVTLKATIRLARFEQSVRIPIEVLPTPIKDSKSSLKRRLDYTVEDIMALAKDSEGNSPTIDLPHRTPDGLPITWKRSGIGIHDILLSLGVLVAALFLTFHNRYQAVERRAKRTTEQIIRDFPILVDQMILLLNAGMVADASLRKIAHDYREHHSKVIRRPLYEGLCEMENRIAKTNAAFAKELKTFAQQSGIKEMNRFATLIEDHMQKGNALLEQMEGEATILWMSRKKRAEERSRVIETKLTFPLVLQLSAIVILTTAPAFLKM